MGYREVESALAGRLNTITGFSTAVGTGNITQGDFRVLSRGHSSAIVLEYSGFDQERVDFDGDHRIGWRVNIDIFGKWKDELNAYNLMGSLRQSVIDKINTTAGLGTNIMFDTLITSGDAAPEDIEVGGVRYAMEILRCVATEAVSVSYVD